MAAKKTVTPAIRELRAAGVDYEEHHYAYSPGGGATDGAAQLGLDLHTVVKTLILETNEGQPLCVLMHGDRDVSLKQLARVLGVKSVSMAQPETAQRYSGYRVGGTSPFGLRTAMPIFCEASVADLETIVINGGRRGFLLRIATRDLIAVLQPTLVAVAI